MDFDMYGIYEHNRIVGFQAAAEPLLHIRTQILDHTANAGLAVTGSIDLAKYFSHLRLSKSLAIQAAGKLYNTP